MSRALLAPGALLRCSTVAATARSPFPQFLQFFLSFFPSLLRHSFFIVSLFVLLYIDYLDSFPRVSLRAVAVLSSPPPQSPATLARGSIDTSSNSSTTTVTLSAPAPPTSTSSHGTHLGSIDTTMTTATLPPPRLPPISRLLAGAPLPASGASMPSISPPVSHLPLRSNLLPVHPLPAELTIFFSYEALLELTPLNISRRSHRSLQLTMDQ